MTLNTNTPWPIITEAKKCPACDGTTFPQTALMAIINERDQLAQAVEDRTQAWLAAEAREARYKAALEWIANDGYKVVPSHWKEIAAAQAKCAAEALCPKK